MAQDGQNLENHVRFDPPYHFFLLPILLISWVLSVYYAVKFPGLLSAWGVIFVIGVIVAAAKMRLYALKVQDRVIRLEERVRLTALLPDSTRADIARLTEQQLVALRFASDGEVPGLVQRALTENLSPADIKKAVRSWRGDYWRV